MLVKIRGVGARPGRKYLNSAFLYSVKLKSLAFDTNGVAARRCSGLAHLGEWAQIPP